MWVRLLGLECRVAVEEQNVGQRKAVEVTSECLVHAGHFTYLTVMPAVTQGEGALEFLFYK